MIRTGLAAPEAALREGTMVDHFRVVRLLGRGGMGEVYLTRDTRLGRRVALKLVRAAGIDRDGTMARFLREAQVTASFSHPNIVSLYTAGEYAGRPYLALEYVEGQTLRERLQEERPGLREAIRIAAAIAGALAEAHERRILHRDLKPENVLLGRDGRPRVVDFGLGKVVVEEDRGDFARTPRDEHRLERGDSDGSEASSIFCDSAVWGTLAYLPPERLRESCSGSEAGDVWALGIMLAELATGQHPYHGLSAVALRAAIIGPEPVPAPFASAETPAELIALTRRCLEKDPTRRPQAEAVAETLERILSPAHRTSETKSNPFRGLGCDRCSLVPVDGGETRASAIPDVDVSRSDGHDKAPEGAQAVL
ncbi:MAG: serine/threonine-protein kinase, partial [Pseudomonadota bacterium]